MERKGNAISKKPGAYKYIILLCLSQLVMNLSYSQNEDSLGSWLVVSGENRVAEKWSVPTVMILRHHQAFHEYEFAFLRTGVSFKIFKNQSFTIGPAYLDSRLYNTAFTKSPSQQFWLYTETSIKTSLKRAKISNRLRWESRWINLAETTKYDSRARYRFQYQHPIGNTFYLKSFDELFYSLSKSRLNQNRFYFGFGHLFSKELSFEVGYLKLHLGSENSDRLRMALLFRTDFFKKSNQKR